MPYPGVDFEANQSEYRYHRYYQWVSFVLFFQSTLFYIPRWLWKMWEGGKIQALMMDLDVGVCSKSEKDQKKKLLVEYLFTSRGHHNWYAGRYFFCELLAMANVIFQAYALDKFFEGEFLSYGMQVIEFSQMDQGECKEIHSKQKKYASIIDTYFTFQRVSQVEKSLEIVKVILKMSNRSVSHINLLHEIVNELRSLVEAGVSGATQILKQLPRE